jgi:membrane-associated protein
MGRLLDQLQEVFGKIVMLDMNGLLEVLRQPEIMTAAFIALAIVIFTETGLLIGFFLPGDSLLVTIGIVAWDAGWPLHWLMLLLSAAAILGNSTGYRIGATAGPRLFTKDESFLFRKSYLLKAQAFYEKHGGKTIILAQFIPIIRTFAPVVAGIGRMGYRRFLLFTVIGAILWVPTMLTLGYILTPVLDQPLKRVFGDEFETAKHIEKVIILVVLLSISPGLYTTAKSWLAKRRAARIATAAAMAEEANTVV